MAGPIRKSLRRGIIHDDWWITYVEGVYSKIYYLNGEIVDVEPIEMPPVQGESRSDEPTNSG